MLGGPQRVKKPPALAILSEARVMVRALEKRIPELRRSGYQEVVVKTFINLNRSLIDLVNSLLSSESLDPDKLADHAPEMLELAQKATACLDGLLEGVQETRDLSSEAAHLEKRVKEFEAKISPLISQALPEILQPTLAKSAAFADQTPLWEVAESDVEAFEQIGKGGFGVVRRGRYQGHIEVAIKYSLVSFIPGSEEEASFLFEVTRWFNLCQGVHKDFILPFKGASLNAERPFILSPYCKNGNLLDFLKKKQWIVSECLRLLYQVAVGMIPVHDAGMVHCDLKPENVLVDDLKNALVGDFGLCKMKSKKPRMPHLSAASTTVVFKDGVTPGGTPFYMAPECFKSYEFTQASDVYAYGIMILYLVFLRWEKPEEYINSQRVLKKKVLKRDPTTFLGGLNPVETVVLRELWCLIQDCCHQENAKRPPFRKIAKSVKGFSEYFRSIEILAQLMKELLECFRSGKFNMGSNSSPLANTGDCTPSSDGPSAACTNGNASVAAPLTKITHRYATRSSCNRTTRAKKQFDVARSWQPPHAGSNAASAPVDLLEFPCPEPGCAVKVNTQKRNHIEDHILRKGRLLSVNVALFTPLLVHLGLWCCHCKGDFKLYKLAATRGCSACLTHFKMTFSSPPSPGFYKAGVRIASSAPTIEKVSHIPQGQPVLAAAPNASNVATFSEAEAAGSASAKSFQAERTPASSPYLTWAEKLIDTASAREFWVRRFGAGELEVGAKVFYQALEDYLKTVLKLDHSMVSRETLVKNIKVDYQAGLEVSMSQWNTATAGLQSMEDIASSHDPNADNSLTPQSSQRSVASEPNGSDFLNDKAEQATNASEILEPSANRSAVASSSSSSVIELDPVSSDFPDDRADQASENLWEAKSARNNVSTLPNDPMAAGVIKQGESRSLPVAASTTHASVIELDPVPVSISVTNPSFNLLVDAGESDASCEIIFEQAEVLQETAKTGGTCETDPRRNASSPRASLEHDSAHSAEHQTPGDAHEQYNLGLTETQKGNLTEAAKFYRVAANWGHAAAQCKLGVCYEEGLGVNPSLTTAADLYKQAASQRHADAQYRLGVCYEEGWGVNPDMAEAAKLYNEAATKGHADAQLKLAICCEKGTDRNAASLSQEGQGLRGKIQEQKRTLQEYHSR
jgi:serine/threonine protein kinase